ncbi:MAG: prepilin peptidase [Microthrixaceae bacterium]|nr:prepilin peptidase [Acidimicrobiales bacterium]MCB9403551.1 prepilin peptidase [Microthrixaceae bacterium]
MGSFLNTLIVRAPGDEGIVRPGPHCIDCDARLGLADLVPVFSWVASRGKCRHCGEPIPVGYPVVEVANLVLWMLAAVRFGASWDLVPYLAFFSVLLALSVIDLELYLLPNRITYPSIVASVVAIPILSLALRHDPALSIKSAYLGGVGYAGFLLVVLLLWELIVRREGMGMGDVKLAILLGLWVGWIHLMLVVYALVVACVIGVVVGLVILVVRRSSRAFPFGPWLAIGAIAVIMYSDRILESLNRLPAAW